VHWYPPCTRSLDLKHPSTDVPKIQYMYRCVGYKCFGSVFDSGLAWDDRLVGVVHLFLLDWVDSLDYCTVYSSTAHKYHIEVILVQYRVGTKFSTYYYTACYLGDTGHHSILHFDFLVWGALQLLPVHRYTTVAVLIFGLVPRNRIYGARCRLPPRVLSFSLVCRVAQLHARCGSLQISWYRPTRS
jgi:hypothetical protein